MQVTELTLAQLCELRICGLIDADTYYTLLKRVRSTSEMWHAARA